MSSLKVTSQNLLDGSAVRCVAAALAASASISIEVVQAKVATSASIVFPRVATSAGEIFGTGAVCRYFYLLVLEKAEKAAAKAAKKKGKKGKKKKKGAAAEPVVETAAAAEVPATAALNVRSTEVDAWIDWQGRVLDAALRPLLLDAAGGAALPTSATDATYAPLAAALAELSAALAASSGAFLCGATPSPADALIALSLRFASTLVALSSDAAALQAFAASAVDDALVASAEATLADVVGGALPSGVASSDLEIELAKYFAIGVAAAYPAQVAGLGEVEVTFNTNPRMKHHYQTNVAMKINAALKHAAAAAAPAPAADAPKKEKLDKKAAAKAKKAKKAADAKQMSLCAVAIVAALPVWPLVASVTVTGGFINVALASGALALRLATIARRGLPRPPAAKRLRILVDYSSPNIAKDMHVGHLRSTIIGDSLCRICEFCGHDVKRVNHIGDWGTQFGMLIAHLKDSYPALDPEDESTLPNIVDLTQFYKAAKLRFKEDEAFKTRSQLEVVKLQSGDEANIAMWKLLCKFSAREINKVYVQLGVHPALTAEGEEGTGLCGESFYNSLIPGVIAGLDAQGLIDNTGTAQVMWSLGKPTAAQLASEERTIPPLILRKSDGGFGYDSTDMTAVHYRVKTMKMDWVIYVVDSGQGVHFKQVFEGAKMAGWLSDDTRLEHINFGVVCGDDKKRLRTSAGESVRLVDLLSAAVDRAQEQVRSSLLLFARYSFVSFYSFVYSLYSFGYSPWEQIESRRESGACQLEEADVFEAAETLGCVGGGSCSLPLAARLLAACALLARRRARALLPLRAALHIARLTDAARPPSPPPLLSPQLRIRQILRLAPEPRI